VENSKMNEERDSTKIKLEKPLAFKGILIDLENFK